MKTITEYRENLSELDKKLGEIRSNCVQENRDPDLKELDLMNDIMDEMERLDGMIQTLERQQVTQDKYKRAGNRKTLSDDDPEKQRKRDQEKKDKFSSFGEQMAAVMRAGAPNAYVDPRLRVADIESRATGMSLSVPSDGGFLVQQDFANEIMREVFDTGLLASRCRRIPITRGNSIVIPGLDETSRVAGSRQGGIRAYWADEATEKTASKPKFRRMEMHLHKMIGLVYLTDELMDDAPALEAYLRQGFVDEFAFQVDDAIMEGTGAGQPQGIKNAACMVEISKETGQTDNTVVYENVIKMWARMLPQAKMDAVWLINTDVTPSLAQMSLAVGSGGSAVYIPPGGASATPYGTLMGKPILEIEQAETVGTAGDIVLANFRRGYLLAEKGGLQSDMSIHVRFIYDESVFRFVLRLDGQPMLSSAITPFKGTNTLSHFVRTAARTS
jgi:HK97 family phage major capsid protein